MTGLRIADGLAESLLDLMIRFGDDASIGLCRRAHVAAAFRGDRSRFIGEIAGKMQPFVELVMFHRSRLYHLIRFTARGRSRAAA